MFSICKIKGNSDGQICDHIKANVQHTSTPKACMVDIPDNNIVFWREHLVAVVDDASR